MESVKHTALGGDEDWSIAECPRRLRAGWTVTGRSLEALHDRVTKDGRVDEKDAPVLKEWIERMHGQWNATLVYDALYLSVVLPLLLNKLEPADDMSEATENALTFIYELAVSCQFLATVTHTTVVASVYCFSCFLSRPKDILGFMVGTYYRQVVCNVGLSFQLIMFLISGVSGFLLTHGLGGIARFNLAIGAIVIAIIFWNFLALQGAVKQLLKAE